MIGHIEKHARRARRRLSRSELAVRLLGLPRFDDGDGSAPGLILIQVDGFSRKQFREALRKKRLPFLRSLLRSGVYCVRDMYPGVPSTTPSIQGELFYNVRQSVPSISFFDRQRRRLVNLLQHEPTEIVEAELRAKGEPLLRGGSAYADIFSGGAETTRFCIKGLGFREALLGKPPWTLLLLFLVNLISFLRIIGLGILEILIAVADMLRGIIATREFLAEMKFVYWRLGICIVLRELTVIGAKIDIARGVPVVHLNLLGFDEQAHRRGPTSRFAHWTLRGIDAAIKRIWTEANRSALRDYEVWVYSDHGQEEVDSYIRLYGKTISQAVAEVLKESRHEAKDRAEGRGVRDLRGRMLRDVARRKTDAEAPADAEAEPVLAVAAMGDLGHVYLPRPLPPDAQEASAEALVREAHIPLVLAADGTGSARAWTPSGAYHLPRDAAAVLGFGRPYLKEAAADLTAVCHHRLAGDFVISGWTPGAKSLTFPVEHGAHGGPGAEETTAFILAPKDAPFRIPDGDRPLRPRDLRQAALRYLKRVPDESPRIRTVIAPLPEGVARLLTYNVHSCVGMDGKIFPERIARVIAQYEPDIVALQELDVERERTGGIDQAALIAQILEMEFHFHPAIEAQAERYGEAVFSRFPMRLVRAGALPQLDRRLEPRGALWVAIEAEGREFHLVNTHLSLFP
ncbi:MAG: alkaline phosphatase family protein, partial [Candidatus Sumerlaeota bacterium]|nr:alkaline phosphatase family protein [Candidatus Sumerlaeota bacterium]